MPGPRHNPFPKSTRSQVWDQLTKTLKADSVLGRRVKLWQFWRGEKDDLIEPTDEHLPVFRMEGLNAAGGWLDESTHQFRWPIKIVLGVGETDLRVMLDYWSAVEVALFTGNTLLNQLEAYNVIQKTLAVAAIEPHLWGDASGIMAVGQLSILMRINT